MTGGPAIGSLFSGYGGLDMGVQAVLGGRVAWHCEVDPAASAILAGHWPDVPNHGDVSVVDWAAVEPVDVLVGGFPCQDLSLAGRRAGLRDGTRSGLWSEFARAIDQLRPQLVVIENVRGILSAAADSDMEPCPWCLGDEPGEPALRALGAVLGELADLGYDARWTGVRAADAGAPHGRYRLFIVAEPAHADRVGLRSVGREPAEGYDPDRRGRAHRHGHPAQPPAPAQDADRGAGQHDRGAASAAAESGRAWADAGRRSRAPAADADDQRRPSARAGRRSPEVAAAAGDRPAAADAGGARVRQQPGGSPEVEAGPTAGHQPAGAGDARPGQDWGPYAAAVARWEHVTGRAAPAPRVGGRLSPAFVEWMMGLQPGHVTGSGISHGAQLKALGNGVVPQQAALALRLLGVELARVDDLELPAAA